MTAGGAALTCGYCPQSLRDTCGTPTATSETVTSETVTSETVTSETVHTNLMAAELCDQGRGLHVVLVGAA
ncbi:hypothetical protein Pla52o_13930 [Novipirellula galeiformis]|uniref:Uncharacterized protein n=1 Tax=Novipirellula galeiformis TaxID=2528004 RepID=A0A5C6CLZ7_9BACT|nr:hypothetical protein Pla52o_13930 [Novipirellula galeiformis]